jgi:hypothetical protein
MTAYQAHLLLRLLLQLMIMIVGQEVRHMRHTCMVQQHAWVAAGGDLLPPPLLLLLLLYLTP